MSSKRPTMGRHEAEAYWMAFALLSIPVIGILSAIFIPQILTFYDRLHLKRTRQNMQMIEKIISSNCSVEPLLLLENSVKNHEIDSNVLRDGLGTTIRVEKRGDIVFIISAGKDKLFTTTIDDSLKNPGDDIIDTITLRK